MAQPRPLLHRLGGLAAAGLALVGCSGAEPQPLVACPDPGIVAGLESTTVFRGGASTGSEADLQYAAAMENIGGGCAYDEDGMRIDLAIDVIVEPGPGFAGGPVSVPWFLAVADPSGAIIDKQVFTSSVAIADGATRGGSRESVEQRFPGVDAAEGAGYRLYLGLEIDREEALRRRATLP
jgi:hypothetical protein